MPFITNDGEKNLEQRLKTIIPYTKEINILVGFFYFSALSFFYEALKDMYEKNNLREGHIKILVGLDVDKNTENIYEYHRSINDYISKKDTKEYYVKSLANAFKSPDLDNQETYEQADFFIKLMEENILVLRKTKKPNHAKLYLFSLDNKITQSLFIVGSSNLTKSGLSFQEEFNVEIKDYGFDEAKNYFDKLWGESVEIDVNSVKDILTQKTMLKKITPFEAYVYSLKSYIDTYIPENEEEDENIRNILKEAGYEPYTYQVEAILQGINIIKTHSGIILADVVGLGKSVIASAIAKRFGARGIVIAPPHLIGDKIGSYGWEKYINDFKLDGWKIFSIGDLENAISYINKYQDIKTIIVDEAHRFRNERTQSYHYLHEICRDKNVILLSATPFNNKPSDIFSLLKLFTIPKKSSIVYEEDLKTKFDNFQSLFDKLSYINRYHKNRNYEKMVKGYYKDIFKNDKVNIKNVLEKSHELAKTIKGIIEPVVIRRNRLDLKYYPEKIPIPEVKDPIAKFFELTKKQSKFYDTVINYFQDIEDGGRFNGAIYFPAKYENPDKDDFIYVYQRNLNSFMRRLLVKRFESSFGAFKESLKRFLDIHKDAKAFIDRTKKFVLDRKLMEDIEEKDEDTIEKTLQKYQQDLKSENTNSKYQKIYYVDKMENKEQFLKDIEEDISLFEELIEKFDSLKLEDDPKANTLINTIKEYIKDRKVLIFTEYVDTAKYLEPILKKEFKDMVLTAIGSLSKSTLTAIQRNFDAQSEYQEDKYKILLATDKLSEGFNLNRAGVIINYDIPWNPVRVIQRVGRINRISKKVYDEIYIINFFPTEKGADIVRSIEIASNKMFMIHKVLGEDSKIFSVDEEPEASSLYKKLNTYQEEEESFITKIKKEYEKLLKSYPKIIEALKDMPSRVKTSKPSSENNLIVLIRKANDLFVGYTKDNEHPKILNFEQIYDKIKCDENTTALPLTNYFWTNYYKIVNDKKLWQENQKINANSLEEKARNMLKTIEDRYRDSLDNELSLFIENLLEDIENFSTLSEYVLSEISSWDTNNLDTLKENIMYLKNTISKDFGNKNMYNKNMETEYIIAVENVMSE